MEEYSLKSLYAWRAAAITRFWLESIDDGTAPAEIPRISTAHFARDPKTWAESMLLQGYVSKRRLYGGNKEPYRISSTTSAGFSRT